MKEYENIVLCGYPVQFLLILSTLEGKDKQTNAMH